MLGENVRWLDRSVAVAAPMAGTGVEVGMRQLKKTAGQDDRRQNIDGRQKQLMGAVFAWMWKVLVRSRR